MCEEGRDCSLPHTLKRPIPSHRSKQATIFDLYRGRFIDSVSLPQNVCRRTSANPFVVPFFRIAVLSSSILSLFRDFWMYIFVLRSLLPTRIKSGLSLQLQDVDVLVEVTPVTRLRVVLLPRIRRIGVMERRSPVRRITSPRL